MAGRASWRTVPGDPPLAPRVARARSAALGWPRPPKGGARGVLLLALYALLVGAFAAFGASARRSLGPAADPARGGGRARGERCPRRASPSARRSRCGAGARAWAADEAVVTFVDGWLHVEGRRAAFALSRADLAEPTAPRTLLALEAASRLRRGGLRGGSAPGTSARPIPRPTAGFVSATERSSASTRGEANTGRSGSRWAAGGTGGDALGRVGASSRPSPIPRRASGRARTWRSRRSGSVIGVLVIAEYGVVWGFLALTLVPGPAPASTRRRRPTACAEW